MPLVMLTLAAEVSTTQSALAAVDCTTEQGIFARNDVALSYGTKNLIRLSDRTTATGCAGTLAWSTAHIYPGGAYPNWVEAGWREKVDPSGSKSWVQFTEWGLNYNTLGNDEFHLTSSNWKTGNYQRWRVESNGDRSWSMYLSFEDGTGWHLLNTYYSTSYNAGYAGGETGRRGTGSSETGMSDDQSSLSYKSGQNSSYGLWNQDICFVNQPSDWTWHWVSNSEFTVVKGSPGC